MVRRIYLLSWELCPPVIDNSSILQIVPSLQALEREEELRWASVEGRTEKVIALLNMGVNIEATDEVRHAGWVMCHGCIHTIIAQ